MLREPLYGKENKIQKFTKLQVYKYKKRQIQITTRKVTDKEIQNAQMRIPTILLPSSSSIAPLGMKQSLW